LLARLVQLKCTVVQEGPVSIELAMGTFTFFIPQPPDGIYYTVGQIKKIEITMVYYGLDLLPLDPNAG
jgi:hypothetical protein